MALFDLQGHSKRKSQRLLSSLTEICCKGLAIYAIRDFCEKGRGEGRTFIMVADKITFGFLP